MGAFKGRRRNSGEGEVGKNPALPLCHLREWTLTKMIFDGFRDILHIPTPIALGFHPGFPSETLYRMKTGVSVFPSGASHSPGI